MAIPDLLRSCPLFFEIHDEEIEKITRRCEVRTFDSGQQAIQEGDEGNEIFVVLQGTFEIQKKTESGVLGFQFLKEGDIFGEHVLLGEKTRRTSVVAKDLSSALEIRYEPLFKLFRTDPELFGLIVLNLSRIISRRLQELNQLTYGFKI